MGCLNDAWRSFFSPLMLNSVSWPHTWHNLSQSLCLFLLSFKLHFTRTPLETSLRTFMVYPLESNFILQMIVCNYVCSRKYITLHYITHPIINYYSYTNIFLSILHPKQKLQIIFWISFVTFFTTIFDLFSPFLSKRNQINCQLLPINCFPFVSSTAFTFFIKI